MRSTLWKDRAACQEDPDLFEETQFSASEGTPAHGLALVGRAKQVCFTCPVRQRCLDAAMEDEAYLGGKERHGIRGGLTARERVLIAAKDPKCARCRTRDVAEWARVINLRRLCRGCLADIAIRPAERYFPDFFRK